MGLSSVRLDLWDEGLAWLRRAVELQPRSVLYLRFLAEAAAARGLHAETKACCERILELEPDDAVRAQPPRLVAAPARAARRGPAALPDGHRGSSPAWRRPTSTSDCVHEEMGEQGRCRDALPERSPGRPGPRDGPGPPRLPGSRGACRRRNSPPWTDCSASRTCRRWTGSSSLFALGEVLDARGQYPAAAERIAAGQCPGPPAARPAGPCLRPGRTSSLRRSPDRRLLTRISPTAWPARGSTRRGPSSSSACPAPARR